MKHEPRTRDGLTQRTLRDSVRHDRHRQLLARFVDFSRETSASRLGPRSALKFASLLLTLAFRGVAYGSRFGMMSSSRHVWVVDDDESVRVALRRLLTSAGFQVTVFPSASAFIEHSAEGTPACLVLDQRMPDVSGLELQRTIN